MLFMVHGVQTQSYELLQMQVVLNTHLTLEFNSLLGLPVALNKHGRPVAGPSTATGDRTVALQLSHHYFTVVTKTDTSTQGEQEDSRVEHHGMVYTRSKHTLVNSYSSRHLIWSIYFGHNTYPVSVVCLFGHCFVQSEWINKAKASENWDQRSPKGHIMIARSHLVSTVCKAKWRENCRQWSGKISIIPGIYLLNKTFTLGVYSGKRLSQVI